MKRLRSVIISIETQTIFGFLSHEKYFLRLNMKKAMETETAGEKWRREEEMILR